MPCPPRAPLMPPKRLSATLAMDKIRKIYEWEQCPESSQTFKQAAAQLDHEFKRQRLYMSSAEREDDEAYGVDDTCESEEDEYDSGDAVCETDEGQYESEDGEDESPQDAETLYPSDEDATVQPDEPTDRSQSGILEPAGPCEETSQ